MYRVQGVDNNEYGPISADQVKQWIIERRLNGTSLAQSEGTSGWKPLSFYPEFAATLAAMGVTVPPPTPVGQNGMAVTGMIFGILSVLCCWCGPLFSILAIVFSVIALSQIKNNPAQGGKPLAIAGIVLGSIGLVEFVLIAVAGAFGQMIDKVKGMNF